MPENILSWKRAFRAKLGSRVWETRCGRYRVHCNEECMGVKMRPIMYKPYYLNSQGYWKPLPVRRRSTLDSAKQVCEDDARENLE